LEVPCDSGVGVMICVGRSQQMGDLVWVIPKVHLPPIVDYCALFDGPGYFQFYPATAALRDGTIRKVAWCPAAMRLMPDGHCNIITRNADKTVSGWLVYNGDAPPFFKPRLTEAERALPVARIINHPLLLEQLQTEWTPSRLHPDD
jgi:hypothetical protein